MKITLRNWGRRVAAFIAVVLALIFFGQLISFSWMAITGAVSLAVWMMIWLWPEGVPERANEKSVQASQRLITKKDSYAGRS